MWTKIKELWYFKDLRNRIVYVLSLLIVFRIAAHIPVPGIDLAALQQLFQSNQLLGLLNVLSGSAMANFSLVALGVGPYITASIIIQLLTMIVPKLEAIAKEGESGRQRLNQYTRILTVPLALLQGYGMIALLSQSGNVFPNLTLENLIATIIVMTGGTIFLMWLGELISEKKIGNGISLIIFAGIVESIPQSIQQTIITFDKTKIFSLFVFIAIALVTIAGVIILNDGQRQIPVSYARRIRGNRMYGGMDTYLPIKVNQAGMIPIIFAISLILFPSLIGQLLERSGSAFFASMGASLITLFQNQLIYGFSYFILVVLFTYFYTSIIFRPDQVSEHLQKQGGFIPGTRPGKNTSDYLGNVSNKIMLAGALSLGLIAVIPLLVQGFLDIRTMTIGGASLLIAVSVVIETWKQVETQIEMREYERI
ncbi:MAG: preprotein translocase subunit SecY [Parcubacteria group bacterium]|nr:preprotein translocase subunit SecY [Parcubacteria group bacterium]